MSSSTSSDSTAPLPLDEDFWSLMFDDEEEELLPSAVIDALVALLLEPNFFTAETVGKGLSTEEAIEEDRFESTDVLPDVKLF